MEKAKILLNKNQYAQSFDDPIIAKCIKSLVVPEEEETDEPEECEKAEDKMIFLQLLVCFKALCKYLLNELDFVIRFSCV